MVLELPWHSWLCCNFSRKEAQPVHPVVSAILCCGFVIYSLVIAVLMP